MDKKNLEVNGNLYGVGVAQDGAVVNQNLILPEHKVPAQLTSKLGKDSIIGREKELEEIDDILNNSDSLLLNGIGGIGKSTIASYYLHSQKDKLDYYGFFEGIESFISELIEPLDLKQEKQQDVFIEALAKLRKLEGKKLLVIDDVKDIEENQEIIERILELKNSGYKILLTSREEIEDVEQYYLDVLSMDDAKKLFNSIYEVKDELLLEEILKYLDCHAFFVEMTAKTLKSKKTLTPELIKDKFENGEFSTIKRKRKESFNDYLNELFSFDELDDEEILMLKQLSVLPSIKIEFNFLQEILDKKDDEEFEELLNYLCEKGWLSSFENGYKLHQIIREFILAEYLVSFTEIENILEKFIELSSYMEIIDFNVSDLVYFESICIVLKLIEVENQKIIAFFGNIALILHDLGLMDKALSLQKESLLMSQSIFGEYHVNTAILYQNLGLFYQSIGNNENAFNLHKKALKIREKNLGVNHLDTASSYGNIATFYSQKGNIEESLKFYNKSLKILERELGKEHLDTAKVYGNLSELHRQAGKYNEALLFSNKSLEIIKSIFGEKHSLVITVYHNLSELYISMSNTIKALEFADRALALSQELLGDSHPKTVSTREGLAELYKILEKFDESISLTQKILADRKILFGNEHPDTARSYNNLAGLYESMMKYEEAIPLYEKALEIRTKLFGKNHPDTATTYNDFGFLYVSMNKYEKALFYYTESLKIREEILDKNHLDIAQIYKNLATVYLYQGFFQKALILLEKALNLHKRVLPKGHPELIDSINSVDFITSKINKINFKKFNKVGRNDPCPCNSGKKYKKCCGKNR